MTQYVPLLLALFAGLLLGLVYFGGLWLTVSWLPRARRPALLALGSFVLRLAMALVAFYVIMSGRWERLLFALFGFLVARTIWIQWLQPARQPPSRTEG